MTDPLRVALYARVSKDDEIQDPAVQIGIIEKLAVARGYTVVYTYVDYASGKDPNRPKFAQMLAAARRHEFDAILALRLDRVMRSTIHLLTILQNLTVYNVALIFSDFEYDPKSPFSEMLLTFMSGIATWERGMISTRTKEGLAHRKSKGQKLGRVPRDDLPLTEIAKLRAAGNGWQKIADAVKIPKSTILDRKDEIEMAAAKIRQTENLPVVATGSDKGGLI